MLAATHCAPSVQGFYMVHSNPHFPDDPSNHSYSGAALGRACTRSAMARLLHPILTGVSGRRDWELHLVRVPLRAQFRAAEVRPPASRAC